MVDDHPLTLHALTAVLRMAGHEIAGVAETADAGVALIEREQPRVAIVDLGLPPPGGLDVLRRVAGITDVRVLVCTGSLEAHELEDAIALGIAGIASKASPLHDVVTAVEEVAAGRFYLDARVRETLAAAAAEGGQADLADPAGP